MQRCLQARVSEQQAGREAGGEGRPALTHSFSSSTTITQSCGKPCKQGRRRRGAGTGKHEAMRGSACLQKRKGIWGSGGEGTGVRDCCVCELLAFVSNWSLVHFWTWNRCGQRFKMRSGHDSKETLALAAESRLYVSVSNWKKSLTTHEVKTTVRLVPTGSPSSGLWLYQTPTRWQPYTSGIQQCSYLSFQPLDTF